MKIQISKICESFFALVMSVIFISFTSFAAKATSSSIEACRKALDGSAEKIDEAKKILGAYLARNITDNELKIVSEAPDNEFPPRRTGDLRYIIWTGQVEPRPPGPLARARIHWGVKLSDPKFVYLIMADKESGVETASPDITFYVSRNRIHGVDRHVLYEQMRQFSGDVTLEGQERFNSWALRVKSYDGYRRAVEFAQTISNPEVLIDIARHM